ncbi:crossover junction endodeoxyribonuclease RuvC [Priestia megaterium]|uniref:crossover junction endodeoxyribonuclease RuvC n=1 Tax=Priestia megaterium TaxID=1404 RepID=UPI000BF3A63C|nr:crossover junction endodeoxyribonuclease RuvC [Priestia megaterium]PFK99857.1 crossover junction endodeoxyribonuclease RuvC [Priestia megaterium]
MFFLGLDPSTKCTGYCVMDEKYDIIESGKINIPEHEDEAGKIFYQIEQIEAIFNKYKITKALCEDQFSKLNIDTLKKLTRVSGTILYLARKHKIDTSLIYPTSWRKVFHGSGKAKKEDTFHKVLALYDFENLVFKHDNDMTDAIGIAWACVDLHKEGVAA